MRLSPGTAADLVVIAPDRRKHAAAAIDIIAKALSPANGYYWMRDACRDAYLLPAHYDWRASRVGLIGDRVVTHYGVWDYQMRIGSARVRVGGVGGVATDGDYRKRGLMDRTARASIEAMRAQGYHVSVLFGIRDFYHRFGYVRAWSDTVVVVNTWNLPKEKPAVRVNTFRPRGQRDLAELYNRCYATATGTAVRPTYTGRMNPWFELPIGYKWSENGRPEGYVLLRRRGNQIICGEYCGDAEEALRVLGMLARRWSCQEIRFDSLPYNCELVRKLRWGDSRVEIDNHRNSSALMALLSLPSVLSKMEDELSSRLRNSALADWTGELLIADTRDEVMLALSGGHVRVIQPGPTGHAIRGGDEIVQLLIGTDRPGEVIEAGRMRISGDAGRLAEVLFPEQHPTLSHPDHF